MESAGVSLYQKLSFLIDVQRLNSVNQSMQTTVSEGRANAPTSEIIEISSESTSATKRLTISSAEAAEKHMTISPIPVILAKFLPAPVSQSS